MTLWLLLILALAWFAYAATRGLRSGLESSPDVFREAQNCIGIWSIVEFGRHELPVLGCDADGSWAVPFELPLYQHAVAGAIRLTSPTKETQWRSSAGNPSRLKT